MLLIKQSVCLLTIFIYVSMWILQTNIVHNCEQSELSGLFNGTDFLYIFQAVRRAVNVLNVSTCI